MARSPLIFSGSSNPELARQICECLQQQLGKCSIEQFPDAEIGVQILENVRERDVFVIQSLALEPNRFLMELLILVDALKRASARSVVAVLPYYAYARQDRKEKGRVPITARLVANLLERSGVTRLLTMDLHAEQIQGFFDIPVDHLYARPLFVEKLKKRLPKGAVVVSPDIGSSKMARRFAEELGCEMAIINKRRLDADVVEAGSMIGDVQGRAVVLVDDICSTGATLKSAAKVCRKKGAKAVYAAVTHGLFLHGDKISGIDELFVSDSVPQKSTSAAKHVVSIAPLLAEAINCVISAKSISSLFKRKI